MFHIWIWVVLTAAAFLAGCSKDADEIPEPLPEEEEELSGIVYIRFQMNLSASGIPGGTRAEEGVVPEETPGTPHENAINTIDLLVYDAESGKLVDIVSLKKTQIEQIVKPNGNGIVPIFVDKLRKIRIYAVANMTVGMRGRLVLGQSGSDVSVSSLYAENDYRKAIEQFVPGSAGKQELLENTENGCIPMTGRFEGGSEIEIKKEYMTATRPLDVTAEVSRIVAKIHVLAKPAEDTPGEYVRSDFSGTTERIGWIRWDDVRYMPNGTNKFTYFFPQPTGRTEYPLWQDPNMSLESYIAGDKFDEKLYGGDYVFYDGMALHKENISPDGLLSKVEPYDRTRLDNTKSGSVGDDRYTRGMYCLENYFDIPQEPAFLDSYENVIPMITHVSIAARLTPRVLVIGEGYKTQMEDFIHAYKFGSKDNFYEKYNLTDADFSNEEAERWTEISTRYRDYFEGDAYKFRSFRKLYAESETDAADIINWSLKMSGQWNRKAVDVADSESVKFSAGTFYVYDRQFDGPYSGERYLYLTADAVAQDEVTDEDITVKARSVPHLGGWGYYYTYLDQTSETQNKKTPYTASQVTRNTYYLVTVGNFGVPGGTITRPEYIKVNTEPVGWDYVGKGDVDLH